jgi:hypothetical protein
MNSGSGTAAAVVFGCFLWKQEVGIVKIEMENNVRCTIRDMEGAAIILWVVFLCMFCVCVTECVWERERKVSWGEAENAVGIYNRIRDREKLAKLKLGF